MEIVGDKSRLVGCNIQITSSKLRDAWYSDKIGEVYIIDCDLGMCVIDSAWGNWFSTPQCNAIDYTDCKILLDDKFLQKFKEENIVVNCETKEETIAFYNWMKDNGYSPISTPESCWENRRESLCFRGGGGDFTFGPRSLYLSDNFTILKFKDLLIPNDKFIDTPEFEEFLEYFKNHKVAVEFEDPDDKEVFCLKIDNSGIRGSKRSMSTPCVRYTNGTWNHSTPLRYKDMSYTIINYKDLKDWKGILLNKKEEKGEMYKINVPISISSIMAAKPCNSSGEVGDFTNELISKGRDTNYEITTWEEFQEYPTLMKYKAWFLGDNKANTVFIEKVEKFEPFDLTFRIESSEQLQSLWCRMNISDHYAIQGEPNDGRYIHYINNSHSMWKTVNKEMYRIKK